MDMERHDSENMEMRAIIRMARVEFILVILGKNLLSL